jgi:hypothetical protein
MEMKKVAGGGHGAFETPPSGRRRYLTAFLCLCVATVCYADRMARSPSMSVDNPR